MKNIIVALIFLALFGSMAQAAEWKGTIWCAKGNDTCEQTCKRPLCTTGGHGEWTGNPAEFRTSASNVAWQIFMSLGQLAASAKYPLYPRSYSPERSTQEWQCECSYKY